MGANLPTDFLWLQADGAKAAQSGNAGVATLASAAQQGGAEGLKQVLQEAPAKEAAAKSLIRGSEESGYKTAKFAGVQAVASGLVGEKEIDKALRSVADVAGKKIEAVAVKGSVSTFDDDGGMSMASMSAPTINIAALDKMRAQKEEAAPAPAKTASMSA